MQITDSSSGQRKITLASNESLDSTTVIAALTQHSHFNTQESIALVGMLYDVLEEKNRTDRDAAHAA